MATSSLTIAMILEMHEYDEEEEDKANREYNNNTPKGEEEKET